MKNSSSYSSGSTVGAVLAVVIVALTVGVAGCTASQGPRSPGPIGGWVWLFRSDRAGGAGVIWAVARASRAWPGLGVIGALGP